MATCHQTISKFEVNGNVIVKTITSLNVGQAHGCDGIFVVILPTLLDRGS